MPSEQQDNTQAIDTQQGSATAMPPRREPRPVDPHAQRRGVVEQLSKLRAKRRGG